MQRAEKDKEKQARVMAAQSRKIELLEALVANQEGMISQRDVHIEGLQALAVALAHKVGRGQQQRNRTPHGLPLGLLRGCSADRDLRRLTPLLFLVRSQYDQACG